MTDKEKIEELNNKLEKLKREYNELLKDNASYKRIDQDCPVKTLKEQGCKQLNDS